MSEEKEKKKFWTKQEQIDYWVQQYLQGKASGDKKMMDICKAIIEKLGGKVPRL
jgi:hypothetical protein